MVVNDAVRVDAKHPASRAAEWVCGQTDPTWRPEIATLGGTSSNPVGSIIKILSPISVARSWV